MDMKELLTLEITEDDGSITEYIVLATFSTGSRNYISLTQTKTPDTIELYRFSGNLEGKFNLDIIRSDMELSEAKAEFDKIKKEISAATADGDDLANDLPVVVLKDGMGREYYCDIIKVFDFKGNGYIALMPQNQNSEKLTVELFQYDVCAKTNDALLELIPQDIFNDVMEHFLIIAQTEANNDTTCTFI